jgi:hypothetical protein
MAMVSKKERVRFTGELSGEGQEATCTALATRVSLPGFDATYIDYSISDVSHAIPDGRYVLSVNGETIPVVRRNGFWVSS